MTKSKWIEEKQALKATQIAFDVSVEAQKIIKTEALNNNLNPPDQIRKILGLSYNKTPARPRLTVSLRDEDFEVLAKKYKLKPDDQAGIRDRVAQELISFAKNRIAKTKGS